MEPVVVSVKSLKSTPETASLKVTVKSTEVAEVPPVVDHELTVLALVIDVT